MYSSCNPQVLTLLAPALPDDPQLYTFAKDFIHPIAQPPSHPSTPASVASNSSRATTTFEPVKAKQNISKLDKDRLHSLLTVWLEVRHAGWGSSVFISRDFGLPPKQMEKIVLSCSSFLASTDIGKKEVLKVVRLDLASDEDFANISHIISEWREGSNIVWTPQSHRWAHKKACREADVSIPVLQPNFGSDAGPSSSTLMPRWSLASVHELSAKDLSLTACLYPDENVFRLPNELLHISSPLGFRTGTGIPAVFPKWVTQVRVRYWILAHRAHRVPVPRCHGYSRVLCM